MRRLILLCAAALSLLTACAGPEAVESPGPSAEETAPSQAAGETTAQAQPPGSVYVDWSRLDSTPPEGARYSRWYGGYTDHLIPLEGGYGEPLIPFVGAVLGYDGWWDDAAISLYGLATAGGKVVCDPVYDGAYRTGEGEAFLLLYRTVLEGGVDEYGNLASRRFFTLAASDGSWVLDGSFDSYFTLDDGRLLLLDTEESFWFCDTNGTLERSPLTEKPSELWGGDWQMVSSFYNGVACLPAFKDGGWVEDRYMLADALTGEVKVLEGFSQVSFWGDGGLFAATDAETGLTGFLDRSGSWAIQPQFENAWGFEGDFSQATLATGERAVINSSGEVVLVMQGERLWQCDGYYLDCTWLREDQTNEVYGVYDMDLRPLPDHPLNGTKLAYSYGVPALREGDLWTIWDGGTPDTVETEADLQSYSHRHGIFMRTAAVHNQFGVYDFNTQQWVVPFGAYSYIYDFSDGEESFYLATAQDGSYLAGDVLDGDGTVLAYADELYGVENGLVRLRSGGYSGWMDGEGNWVFRWPLQSNDD